MRAARARELDDGAPDQMSGTTAVVACVSGEGLVKIGNVGDSRALLGVEAADGELRATPLSYDHVPTRRDEYDRA